MYKALFYFLLLLLISDCALARISGRVIDSVGAIPSATITLFRVGDSFWLKAEIADDNGFFEFRDVAPGNYLLTATSEGYRNGSVQVTVDSSDKNIVMLLHRVTASLGEVTVTSKKQLIETGTGKIVLNIDAIPGAVGANALELLKRSPGVTVNQKGEISMMGKQGVLVLIDDRPTYLAAEQLAEYLKTIPSEEIAQIELITQPSSKYDAAGNAGIINFKRKKNRKEGWNGNASADYSQAIYEFGSANLLLNYKKNKLNLSLTGSQVFGKGFAKWDETQTFIDPSSRLVTNSADIHSLPVEHYGKTNVILGADYNRSEKSTCGGSVKCGYHYNGLLDRVSATNVDAANTTYNNIYSPDGFVRQDMASNAYLTHKFSKESELSINADFMVYANNAHQDITNISYDSLMKPLPDSLLLKSHQPSQINVYSLKADYTRNGKLLKLEAGYKASLVHTDNDARFETYVTNTWIPDTTRSNRFVYDELINAAYADADKNLGRKWEVKVGIRAEQTNARGVQQVNNQDFNRSYLSPFATAYIVYKMDTNNNFELNYGRRINRPSYNILNPFIYYAFQYSYSVGNPNLQPEFTNNIEIKHSYKGILITTLRLSATTGIISDILEVNNSTNVVYTIPENMANNQSASVSALFNKELTKWWTLNTSGSLFYDSYKGSLDNQGVSNKGTGFVVNLGSQFDFKRGWKADFLVYHVGNYVSSVTTSAGQVSNMTFGAAKKIRKNVILKLAVEDPFSIYKMEEINTLSDFQSVARYHYDSRRVAMGCTVSFGKTVARRDVSAPEESKRIKID